ncbi:hypothetical protein TNCV_3058781 [Trichonephila clavipes]|nr:hypothetical protein TNCV_3058781 [Trichonephila clavipes]
MFKWGRVSHEDEMSTCFVIGREGEVRWLWIGCPEVVIKIKLENLVPAIAENLIDSNPMDIIENEENSPTFISFSGSVSNPNLLLTRPTLSDKVQLKLTDSLGGAGPKILLSNIIKYGTPYWKTRLTYWNPKTSKLD